MDIGVLGPLGPKRPCAAQECAHSVEACPSHFRETLGSKVIAPLSLNMAYSDVPSHAKICVCEAIRC